MPLIDSPSKEARQSNIEELIKAGHDPEQAVAIGYAHQRKMHKMSAGGEVAPPTQETTYDQDDGGHRNLVELNDDSNDVDMDDDSEDGMAEALAKGGPVQQMAPVATEQKQEISPVMGSGLSEDQKAAIMKKKKTRVFE